MTRRALAGALLAASCVLCAAPVATASSEGSGPRSKQPTLLWKSFPLRQQPTTVAGSRALPSSTRSVGNARDPLVVGVLLAVMLGSGVVAAFGIPTPDRIAEARWRLRHDRPRRS